MTLADGRRAAYLLAGRKEGETMEPLEWDHGPMQYDLRVLETTMRSVVAEFARPLELIELNRHYLTAHLHKNGPDYAEQEVQTALEDIGAAAVVMNRLADNFVSLCTCLCGTVVPQESCLDLAAILRSICVDQEAIYQAIGVRLTVEYDPGAAWYVMADPVLTERILFHLLSNGLRACSPGGSLIFRLSCCQDEIRLTVQDDGCGMTPQQRSEAFSPHKAAHQSERFQGGAGVGLYLCSEYCRLMRWSIELPECEQGTTVVLTIPMHGVLCSRVCIHSAAAGADEVSRAALMRELRSVPGLEKLPWRY